jgi:hypothetical protein
MEKTTADPTRLALVEYFPPRNERVYEMLAEDFGWEG